jgi:hypothetical protein
MLPLPSWKGGTPAMYMLRLTETHRNSGYPFHSERLCPDDLANAVATNLNETKKSRN